MEKAGRQSTKKQATEAGPTDSPLITWNDGSSGSMPGQREDELELLFDTVFSFLHQEM